MNSPESVDGARFEQAPQGDARDLWRVINELIADLLLQVRPDGTIIFLNRPPHGITASELLGTSVLDLVAPEMRDGVRHCLMGMTPGEATRRRLVQTELPDGTRRLYRTNAIPVARDGRVVAITVAARDVALPKPADTPNDYSLATDVAEQIRQIQKLQLTGLLAAGMVHDFNNILTILASAADLLHDTLATSDPLQPEIENMQRAIRHGTNLTQQLMLLARRQTVDRKRVELESAAQEAVGLARGFLGSRIRLVTQLDAPGAMVLVESGGIEQVLLNLLLNSRDAMPEGGTILVATSRLTYSATTAPRGCKLRGPVVRLRVVDSGTGIDAETRERIFQPFFSTKPPERGTGLGLPTIEAIVKDAGGCLELASRMGAGTVVDVVLPDADRVACVAA